MCREREKERVRVWEDKDLALGSLYRERHLEVDGVRGIERI